MEGSANAIREELQVLPNDERRIFPDAKDYGGLLYSV